MTPLQYAGKLGRLPSCSQHSLFQLKAEYVPLPSRANRLCATSPRECTALHVRSGACEAARAPWFGGASSSHPRRFTAPWRSLLLGFPPHARRSAHHGCPDVAASLTERGAHRGMAAWPSRPQSWRWPSVQRLASTRLWLSGPRHCAGRPSWARVQDDLSGCTRC